MTGPPYSLDGSAVIVTGASSGIGETIAERFAAEGADVAVCSREQGNVDPVAEAINGRDGGRALAVECDIRDRDAVEAFVDATVEAFGGIDCLINNAAAGFIAPFDDITPNGWQVVMDTNLTGTYNCTQAAGEHLKRGGGTVINISSMAGIRGAPRETHYAVAKAGLVTFTRSLAFEWAADGVRVNCIAPGFVATAILEDHWGISADEIDRGEVRRRLGLPEEIADIARFLATPASSFVNGETIVAEGVPRAEDDDEIPDLEEAGP